MSSSRRIRIRIRFQQAVRAYLRTYHGCRNNPRAVREVAASILSQAAVDYVATQPRAWWRSTGVSVFDILRVIALGLGLL